MNHEHKMALAAINSNGSLDAALEALKERMGREILRTDPHESKKREDCYTKYRMIADLKEVIKAAINEVGELPNG